MAVRGTVRIEAQDIAFDRARIEVAPGETIRFVVTNTGELVHDFTIGTAAAQAAHRREMTAMLEEQSRADPAAVLHQDDPNAVMLAPGETRELIWSFPDEPMTLEFACNVPGHYEAGMKGALVVR